LSVVQPSDDAETQSINVSTEDVVQQLPGDDTTDWIINDTIRELIVRRPIAQNLGDLHFKRSEHIYKKQKRFLSLKLFNEQ